MSQPQIGIKVVGIMSPGDMGHAIGRELRRHGLDVVACLDDRSDRTQRLSHSAGIRQVETLRQFVDQADLILSVLVPAHAESSAKEIAQAIREERAAVHFVECNAISPSTASRIGEMMRAAEAIFSDGSIIGFPPSATTTPKLYVSGPNAEAVRVLDGKGMTVKVIGPHIGQASGIKMCYAALTKGTFALYYALLIAADRLNLLDDLLAEFESSQPEAFQQMHRFLPVLPAKAGRWIGEMEEIAATFEQAGVTPGFHEAAATIYRSIRNSALGDETPESIEMRRTLEATIAAVSDPKPLSADHLPHSLDRTT